MYLGIAELDVVVKLITQCINQREDADFSLKANTRTKAIRYKIIKASNHLALVVAPISKGKQERVLFQQKAVLQRKNTITRHKHRLIGIPPHQV